MEPVPGALTSVPIWHLVFQDTSRWWGVLFRRGHGHCWAFGFWPEGERGGRWVVFDPAYEGFQIRLAHEAEVIGWLAAGAAGRLRVLRVLNQWQARSSPRWVVTCAGAVAALVGLRETPLTPWRLACIARRHGAVEVDGGEPFPAEDAERAVGDPDKDGRGVGRGAARA